MPDPRSVQDWHDRFLVQSSWTRQIRQFLYPQFGLHQSSRVLEVGCGTGVITAELQELTAIPVTGIDILPDRLAFASVTFPEIRFAGADAMALPFADNTFDLVAAHFLFLWLPQPVKALREIIRVLKPGGVVAALAEPDHAARVDAPEALIELGKLQTASLAAQGANPRAGRSLPQWFSEAGVGLVEFGVSGFQEHAALIPDWLDSEWRTLRADLAGTLSENDLTSFEQLDKRSRQTGSRVLWVPTFYAYGKKPGILVKN